MFQYQNQPQDDANVRPLADEDRQQLLRLVQRYGIPSLLCALTGSPASCKLIYAYVVTCMSSSRNGPKLMRVLLHSSG